MGKKLNINSTERIILSISSDYELNEYDISDIFTYKIYVNQF